MQPSPRRSTRCSTASPTRWASSTASAWRVRCCAAAAQPGRTTGSSRAMERITIDPVTRLEGHGKIEIFLDPDGEVANAYFQIPELRGFERFCVGRPVEEMPTLTNRICGVCPEAHHMAAAKAADAVYHVDPPRPAKLLPELLYSAFFVADHTTHFYALGGPDLIVGPDAPGLDDLATDLQPDGPDDAEQVALRCRRAGHRVIELIGGRKVHPCT